MLRLRVLSALIGIPIILGAVYLGGPWYALLLLLVVNLGIYEFTRMLRAKGYRLPSFLGYLGVTAIILMIFLEQLLLIFPVVMLVFVILFVAVLIHFDKIDFWESALIFWGIIYLGGLCGFMLLLRQLTEGALYTYLLLFGVWLNDSFAYFIGLKWGRRRLAPGISPKKSVEGALAGIAGTVLVALLVAALAPRWLPMPPAKAALLAVGIAIFAQIGDLLESAMKRQFQVKDSGQLIPGHGGIMDRFDSLMLAAPFVYYFFILA